MAICEVRNCIYNEDGDCDNFSISVDGYCTNKTIDEGRCEYCGTELCEVFEETLEHFGIEVKRTLLRCPNGCDD